MKKIISIVLALALLCGCTLALASCGKSGKVKIIDIPLTEEVYAFCLKKGNDELTEKLDTFLAGIKADGSFQAVLDKYFKGEGTKVGVEVFTGENAVNDDNTLVVETNCPFEPFEYIGDDGLIYGVDIEIAKLFAEHENMTLIVINNPSFDAIFTEVDSGYADIGMAGITVSEDRVDVYNFTEGYYNASQKIIVMEDNTDFDNCKTAADVEAVLAGLTGKKVGYQTGTTGNWYVEGDEDWGYDGFANITAKGYATALDAINDMINGNIYAVVVDEAPGAAMVAGVNN